MTPSLVRLQIIDTVSLDLPKTHLLTEAFWLDLTPGIIEECHAEGVNVKAAVHGASHALVSVASLWLQCDCTAELAVECPASQEVVTRHTRILAYDRNPGGLGVSYRAHSMLLQLLCTTLDVIRNCPCDSAIDNGGIRVVSRSGHARGAVDVSELDKGCPACVQSSSCSEHNLVTSKSGALFVLERIMQHLQQNPAASST